MNPHKDLVYIMIDIDSFEVQVWLQQRPDLAGKPVIIHNSKNKIIAVSYEAKGYGVSRSDTINEAMEKCPELELFQIPDRWGKPDQKTPRHASRALDLAVRKFLADSKMMANFWMASRDELFTEVHDMIEVQLAINCTQSEVTYPMDKTVLMNGNLPAPKDIQLQFGGKIAGELLQHIKAITGFQGSAGVGRNTLIAKLACGVNKPAGVTIVTPNGQDDLFKCTKLEDATGLGGKRGQEIKEHFKTADGMPIQTLFDFKSIDNADLVIMYGEKVGKMFDNLARGISNCAPKNSLKATIMCSKMLFGKTRLKSVENLQLHLQMLSEELKERLDEELEWNQRRPKDIKVELKRKNRPPLTNSAGQGTPPRMMKSDSGTFNCPTDISADTLVEAAMNKLETNWERARASGWTSERLTEVFQIGLVAKNFIPVETVS